MVSISPWGARAPQAPRRIAVAAAPAPAQSPAPKAAAEPGVLDRIGGFFAGVGEFVRHTFAPLGTWHNPAAPRAADHGGLKVVTFNVMVKTTNLDAVAQDLAGLKGDVVCLQETSERTARELARRLGMHVAWHEDPKHAYGGTAVLSKYPIAAVEEVSLTNPWKVRLSQFWSKLRIGEPRMAPLDCRHLLHATLKVGERTVDVLNGHLTLFGDTTNADQVAQIADLAAGLAAKGHTVVAAGDWNTNWALAPVKPGVADPKGAAETATDTAAEWRDRYPGKAIGNMANPAGQAAARKMHAVMGDAWDAPVRTVRVEGVTMTLEQAAAALRAEPAGTKRAAALRLAVDGISHLGARKRLDDVFVSRDARIVAAHIDQTTRASDHQPLVAELEWK